jgi:hypothetical protein
VDRANGIPAVTKTYDNTVAKLLAIDELKAALAEQGAQLQDVTARLKRTGFNRGTSERSARPADRE